MKLIHITDLHLSSPPEPLYGLDPFARFDKCLSDIEAWHSDAAFCIISGDLTDGDNLEAYQALRDRLATFPFETHLMIGNHDTRTGYLDTFPDAPTDTNGFVQHAFDTEAGRFILLDTFNQDGTTSAGIYCAKRRAWLEGVLAEATSRNIYLFMHHPPMDIAIPYMDRIKLEDPDPFTAIVTAHKSIKHIFFGHVHRTVFGTWHGISYSSLPGINHQVPLDRRSVNTVYSDEPPAYGIVIIENGQLIIHTDAFLNRRDVVMPLR